MIPVRIACNEEQIRDIISFTLKHYKQIAVMAYKLSDKVLIVEEWCLRVLLYQYWH